MGYPTRDNVCKLVEQCSQWEEKSAEYYKVELWDRLADLAMQYLEKGNQVTVIGRLSMERWTDREGNGRLTPLVSGAQISLPPKPKPPPLANVPVYSRQRTGTEESGGPEEDEKKNNLVAKEFGGTVVLKNDENDDDDEKDEIPANLEKEEELVVA